MTEQKDKVDYGDYISEFVYGSVDGVITTFAIISGAIGSELAPLIIVILGLSSVLADGFSMGVSSYLSAQAAKEHAETNIESMKKDPIWIGIVTFISFVLLGSIPVIPFMVIECKLAKYISLSLAAILFIVIGLIKSTVNKSSKIKGVTITFGLGMSAAIISWYVAYILNTIYGV